ncbi:MAG: DUF4912 domain-containing protein [Spirochaetia bacterium]
MTHEKLLSVTDAELRSIAYSHGIYEEGSEFDREMLIDELVEDLELLSAESSSVSASRKRYEFTAEVSYLYEDEGLQNFVFLKRYGETRLITIQRDTTWLFVDWEISPTQMKGFRQMGNYNGIFLRFSCYKRDDAGNFHIEDFQDNFLETEYGRQYFQLVRTNGQYWHQLSLRVESGGKEYQVATTDMLLTSIGASETVL